jgi:hypothetical protein
MRRATINFFSVLGETVFAHIFPGSNENWSSDIANSARKSGKWGNANNGETERDLLEAKWAMVVFNRLKGTQDCDFFWLQFWNLYYFFISYVKIGRFYQKKILIRPLFFRLVWD